MVKRAFRPYFCRTTDVQDTASYVLTDHKLLAGNYCVTCKKCKKPTTNWSEHQNRFGVAVSTNVTCPKCKKDIRGWTSKRVENKGKFDVNIKMVEFALRNQGYKIIQDFDIIFNSKIMASSNFFSCAKMIEGEGIQECEESLQRVRKVLHQILEIDQPDIGDVKNIEITCDGTWAQRGFVSKYGGVPVIHYSSGLVLDYEVLSKYCAVCNSHKDDESDAWYAAHENECQKNYEGSSPAMEVEGWKRLFRRSVEKGNFRYTKIVSDGDSKAFNAVKGAEIDGEVEITKEECINHVAKRMGKALRD